jgi:hypothetical protein
MLLWPTGFQRFKGTEEGEASLLSPFSSAHSIFCTIRSFIPLHRQDTASKTKQAKHNRQKKKCRRDLNCKNGQNGAPV